jgi:3-deoxy-D-manno-octulosonic-acid transferase
MRLLDAVYAAGLVLGAPYIGLRMLFDRRYRDKVGERFGGGGREPRGEFPVWFHGASAGEVLAVRSLYRMMREEIPGFDAVFSAATYTGRSVASKRYPECVARYLPIDMGPCVGRALATARPKLVVLVEGDIWPNFICAAKSAGSRVIVVNGTFSERSVARYRRLKTFFGPAFDALDLLCVRDEEQVKHIAPLGLPPEKIVVTGNVKYDNLKTEHDDTRDRVRGALGIAESDVVLMGGSTHAGEEGPLLDLFADRRDFRLIIAPRYPHRAGEVEAQVRERKLSSVRYSKVVSEGARPAAGDVVVVDTLGDLEGMYQVATVAFIGGSLIPRGGQNMMEAAAFGVAVIYGPHTWVQQESVEMLEAADAAVQVPDEERLKTELGALLDDPARRAELGRRARNVILENSGASGLTFDRIKDLVLCES